MVSPFSFACSSTYVFATSNKITIKITHVFLRPVSSLGFDDMDSIYASPEDFQSIKHRDRARGLHLLEYFVNRCHEIGVLIFCALSLRLVCIYIEHVCRSSSIFVVLGVFYKIAIVYLIHCRFQFANSVVGMLEDLL